MANVIAKGLREQSYAVDVADDGEVGLYQTSTCCCRIVTDMKCVANCVLAETQPPS